MTRTVCKIGNPTLTARLFALSYCLIFFNVWGLPNEIWPYYFLIVAIDIRFKIFELILYAFLFLASICAAILYSDLLILREFIYVIIVIRTCFWINSRSFHDISIIIKYFQYFIFISIIWGVIQLILPQATAFTYMFFSGRPEQSTQLMFEIRNAATLIGPEPAYTAMHLLSMLLFINSNKDYYYFSIFCAFVIVILTKSIVAAFFAVIFITYVSFLSQRKFALLLLVIVCGCLSFYFYDAISQQLPRLVNFISAFLSGYDLLQSEQTTGSIRLQQIMLTQFKLVIFEFTKPFTIFGAISLIFTSPIIALFILFVFIIKFRKQFSWLSLLFPFLFGPVLLWPLLYSIISTAPPFLKKVKLED